MKAGASNLYLRLLRGQVTPEHYVRVMKRAVDMRLRLDRRERGMARYFERHSR